VPEKYRAADAVILRHPDAGVLRLDPARYGDDAAQAAKKEGWAEAPPRPDGFRTRRKRDMAKLMREGVIADPATGGQPHQEYGPEVFVVNVPVGRMGAAGLAPDGKE
jgi:hypothetical protein